jgi:hypothetical protein
MAAKAQPVQPAQLVRKAKTVFWEQLAQQVQLDTPEPLVLPAILE